ncbi:Stf0 family sulfotransferase [Pararhodobacter sp. CCB-MM2]|uniref:Stf0 family sulfotransferase n=1 Tax=Pararhodobacter sp. CCB-MM2 TaxID=1786003 RepID=UPI00083722A3|nr:Stf0 family sulfotransferase [Pararhodobacter sp. CCB-MM2]
MSNQPYQSYFICTSPRSGSTMLCELLAGAKVAGKPDSHFHEPSIDAWLDYYDLEAADFATRRDMLNGIFRAAKMLGKGQSDICGVRLQRGSFAFFMEQLKFLYSDCASDVERIEAAFGPTLFIFLSRKDKLDQAISYIRAEQTGLWHRRADGSDLERLEPQRDDGYDPDAIRSQVAEFTAFDASWRSWFEEQSVSPLEVSYEDLSSAPQKQLARILDTLGVDGSIAHDIPTPTAKLADGINRLWRDRFELDSK